MKCSASCASPWRPPSRPGVPRPAVAGMTLAEMMMSMGIFGLVILGLVYTQIFILRYDELTTSKLGASEMSRMSFNDLVHDIRVARSWAVGTGDQNGFTPTPNGSTQSGNALQLCATIDTNSWVRYYFATNVTPNLTNSILCRLTNGMSTNTVLAQNLTNTLAFVAENFQGSNVTTLQYKYVIHVVMRFCEYQYPLTIVGPGYYYDDYKMEFRVASHNL